MKVLRSNKRIIEDYDIFRDVANQVQASAARGGFEQNRNMRRYNMPGMKVARSFSYRRF